MYKNWIIVCFLFLLFGRFCDAKTKITNVDIQENSGITQIVFDMDALIYPEATLDKSNNQIVVAIPDEASWAIPKVNESMIGFFEGYKLKTEDGNLTFKADVLPGVKMVDSYSVNDDPEKPQFVIELSKDNKSDSPSLDFSAPEDVPEEMKAAETHTPAVVANPEESVKKLITEKAAGFTVFKLKLGPTAKVKARQDGNRVIVDIPQTDWSQVDTDEKFLGVMRDTKTGNMITIEAPLQDAEGMDSTDKPQNLITDYFVEEETPGQQKLILRLEEGVHMISELRKKQGTDQFYVLKFKKKDISTDKMHDLSLHQVSQKMNTPKKPSTVKVFEEQKQEADVFNAKPVGYQSQTFKKEPLRTVQEVQSAQRPIKRIKRQSHQNPMIDRLAQSQEAQVSSESGSTPAWVLDAQKNMRRK